MFVFDVDIVDTVNVRNFVGRSFREAGSGSLQRCPSNLQAARSNKRSKTTGRSGTDRVNRYYRGN